MKAHPSTIHELLAVGADAAAALLAPEREPLTYRDLRSQAERTVAALNRLGIGRNERVAIVLPNGPAMASAFVSLAAGATTAPLNPAYRREEFEFYLSDLHTRALLVERGSTSAAVEAAAALKIPLLELVSDRGDPAGRFELIGPDTATSLKRAGGMAESDDVALILHTSGTTSRPKIVPLSHVNVCASAHHIRRTLALAASDRCLNVMPLFHIHGLMAAVLASISAGASVFCTPGFNALRFFAWLGDARPSWYTAVPTMHQALLARAERNAEIITGARLRFIRSSSSSLPPQVLRALEETFGAPVVEAYAMTEAAHQMTSNPLPPSNEEAGHRGCCGGPRRSR